MATKTESYAIIAVGGKQYVVREGERLVVDRVGAAEGKTFNPGVLFVGGDGKDTITAGSGSDTIFAGHGGDLIMGGSGQALIFGGDGPDTIFGGSGPDTI